MKNQITEQDMAVLRDIAANQLSPLKKMQEYLYSLPIEFSMLDVEVFCKDVLDEVAAELGFQTKFSKPCH